MNDASNNGARPVSGSANGDEAICRTVVSIIVYAIVVRMCTAILKLIKSG